MASMRRWILFASLLLLFGTIAAWTELHWAIETRSRHAPKPDDVVKCDGVQMSQESCLLNVLAPREDIGNVRHFLLSRRNLVPLEYVAFGLGGACVGIWLLLIQAKPANPSDWDTVFVSILLSGAAGFISYFLLLLPLSIADKDSPTTMEKWFVLPLLAGAFNTVFYDALPGILTALLDWIKGRLPKKGGAAIVLFAIAAAARPASAQVTGRAAAASQQARSATASFADRKYFRCHEPNGCTCRATSEEKKTKCPECTEWEEVTLSDALAAFVANAEATDYRNAPGAFVFAASQTVLGSSATRPAAASAMFADPQQFGYNIITADQAKPGTVVLYKNTAGILVDSTTVLYPSTKLDGKLNLAHIDVVGGQAKLVVPKDVKPELR